MDQEKIGKFIKEIRIREKLSQQKFAEKYGVTYQAVSKWENGKNIPDITILKQMCNEYGMNLDDLLETKISPTKNKKTKVIFSGVVFLLITFIILLFIYFRNQNQNHFEFKTLSTTCNNFNLYGSIAYNDNKSSIYISNITYCGGDDTTEYSKIECTLYENVDKQKTEISKYHYNDDSSITLEAFLKDLHFHVDNYEKTCEIYKENTLSLEIYATDCLGKITTYKIPLTLKENCSH